MSILNVIVQIVDPENGQRSDPRMSDRVAFTRSFLDVKERDPAFLKCFVLVLMEEIEEEGKFSYRYSIAPLITVERWIELFPIHDEVPEND